MCQRATPGGCASVDCCLSAPIRMSYHVMNTLSRHKYTTLHYSQLHHTTLHYATSFLDFSACVAAWCCVCTYVVGLQGDGDIVLVDDGDEEEGEEQVDSSRCSSESWCFPLHAGDMYVLR